MRCTMRGSFKFTLGVGVMSLVAWSMPACGGDDDEGGSSGKGGKGGSDAGKGGSGGTSTGGSAGGGGTAGGGGGLTCGTSTCTGWKVGGLVDVAPCCAGTASDKCGATVDSVINGLTGIPTGCYETDQVGAIDCGCDP